MKIIITQDEIIEIIKDYADTIIYDQDFKVDFTVAKDDVPMSAEITIVPLSPTVGNTILDHVGPDVKKETLKETVSPVKKRTRRSRAQMIADGDATPTAEEQAEIDAKKELKPDPLIEKEKTVIEEPEETKVDPKNVDSLFST